MAQGTAYEIVRREVEKRSSWLNDGFKLAGNPFTVKELFSIDLDKKTIKKHTSLFQDREEISTNVLSNIKNSESYKTIFYGDKGVGKSSLLNFILNILKEDGYLVLKINIKSEDVEDNRFRKTVLHSLSNVIVGALEKILDQEAARSFFERLKTGLFDYSKAKEKREIKGKLWQISTLALLYSGDMTTIQEIEGKKDFFGLSIGTKELGLSFSREIMEEVEKSISYKRIPDEIFRGILRAAWDISQDLKYEGIVIGFDDADKLNDKELESKLVGIIKDLFYAEAKYHIIVVFAKDIINIAHKNVFFFENIRPLEKNDFIEALNQLFKAKSLKKEEIFKYFSQEVLDRIYKESNGLLRSAIILCNDALAEACRTREVKITTKTFMAKLIPPEKKMMIKEMDQQSKKYQILRYLKENEMDYSSNEKFLKAVDLSQPRLNQLLNELEEEKFVLSKKYGRKKMYRLNIGMSDLLI